MAEIGLRFWNGSAVEEITVLTDLTDQPLRISKDGTTYAIPLVDISSPDALPIRIQTPGGLKALGYTVPVIPPTVNVSNMVIWDKHIFRTWHIVYVSITIVDYVTSLPIPNASVEILWDGEYYAIATGLTNSSGVVIFSTHSWVTLGNWQRATIRRISIGGVEQVYTGAKLSAIINIG